MESTGQHHVRIEKMLNPFSSPDRQHFPEFSPMFRKKTPTSSEGKAFRWSIDQLAILNPAQIDTPGFMHHSPDNDERQKEIDQYFSKTVLPSPWPAMKHPASSHTHKRVTFSPLPPSAAFIQEKGLVESRIRNSVAVDDGELVGGVICEGSSEDLARDLGNTSLRRKLFGQPDRQGSGEGVGGESPTFPHSSATPSPLPNGSTPSSNGFHLLLHTPESHFSLSLSPIRSEGVADEGKGQDSPGLSLNLQHNALQ